VVLGEEGFGAADGCEGVIIDVVSDQFIAFIHICIVPGEVTATLTFCSALGDE